MKVEVVLDKHIGTLSRNHEVGDGVSWDDSHEESCYYYGRHGCLLPLLSSALFSRENFGGENKCHARLL